MSHLLEEVGYDESNQLRPIYLNLNTKIPEFQVTLEPEHNTDMLHCRTQVIVRWFFSIH